MNFNNATYEPPHVKTNKITVCPAKIQISLGIRPVWSESSLSAWRKLGSLATHSEDWSDWADAQADLSLRWANMSVCWVTRRLILRCSHQPIHTDIIKEWHWFLNCFCSTSRSSLIFELWIFLCLNDVQFRFFRFLKKLINTCMWDARYALNNMSTRGRLMYWDHAQHFVCTNRYQTIGRPRATVLINNHLFYCHFFQIFYYFIFSEKLTSSWLIG